MTTKTTKITAIFSVVVISMILTLGVTNFATAEKETNFDEPEPFDGMDEFRAQSPSLDVQEFSDQKIEQFVDKALRDVRVTDLMKDKNYEYDGISYRLDPEITVFTLTFKADDKTQINIGFEDGEIDIIKEHEFKGKWDTHRGIVNKYYDGSFDAKGIGHKFDLPSSFSTNDSYFNALLTNAVKNGSDYDDLCDSSAAPNTYWGQAGVRFNDNGIEAGWADTEEDCEPTVFLLSVDAGDTIEARVYLDSSVSNKWWMTVDNKDDIYGAYGKTKTITGSSSVIKDSVYSGVWWETNYAPNQGWDTDFGSDVVSDWASYKYTGNNGWYLWGSETQDTSICNPTANPTSVVSGAFDTGNRDVTWDVSDIEDDCGH